MLLIGLAAYVVAPVARERSGTAAWRYVGSSARPGTVLTEVPAAVSVRLSDSVAEWSRVEVNAATVTLDGFTVWNDATAAAGRDSTDPTHRTLTATLRPVPGARLYAVEWTASDPRGGISGRSGKFYFGVGEPVPEKFTAMLGGGVVRDEPIVPRSTEKLRVLAAALFVLVGAGAARQWFSPTGSAPGGRRRGRDDREVRSPLEPRTREDGSPPARRIEHPPLSPPVASVPVRRVSSARVFVLVFLGVAGLLLALQVVPAVVRTLVLVLAIGRGWGGAS